MFNKIDYYVRTHVAFLLLNFVTVAHNLWMLKVENLSNRNLLSHFLNVISPIGLWTFLLSGGLVILTSYFLIIIFDSFLNKKEIHIFIKIVLSIIFLFFINSLTELIIFHEMVALGELLDYVGVNKYNYTPF